MAQVAHAFTVQMTRQTVTSTTYTTVASVTASALTSAGISVGSDVLIWVSAEMDAALNTSSVLGIIAHAGTTFALTENRIEAATGGSAFPHHYEAFVRWTTVTSEDIQFQIAAGAASQTVGADEIVIVVMSLEDLTVDVDYFYAEVGTDTALSVTPLTDGASITFTPPANTDWLVAVGSKMDVTSLTTQYGTRIFSQGTYNETVPSVDREGENAADFSQHICWRVFTGLANSSQTFREESFNRVGAASGTRLDSVIFALNLHKFKNHISNWDNTNESLGTTAFADPFVVGSVFTPDVTGDAWIIAMGVGNSADANLREIVHHLQVNDADSPSSQSALTTDGTQDLNDRDQIGRQTVHAVTASTSYTIDWEGHTNTVVRSVDNRGLVAFSFELSSAVAAARKAGRLSLMGAGHGAPR